MRTGGDRFTIRTAVTRPHARPAIRPAEEADAMPATPLPALTSMPSE